MFAGGRPTPQPAPYAAAMAELVATYRMQLGPDHGFDAAAALIDHLAELGVSHLYASPVAEAVEGSNHGYDVVDHTAVRAELGGRDGLDRLARALRDRGLGLVIDTVPNHASVASPSANVQWWQTLQHGPDHPSARFFDVDWGPAGQVLLPILGEPLDEVIARGGIAVSESGPGPLLVVDGTELPLAPGTAGLPIDQLLDAQHYRLIHWRSPERNVRRFFTIDDLVAVRAEVPEVATAVDAIPVALRHADLLDGVRVDHVDGLADPGGYLHGLRDRCRDGWIVVEKILAPGEQLPASWPVQGTTGYDFIRVVDHLFVDPTGEDPLTTLWAEVSGDPRGFDEIRREARREVLAGGLAPDLDRLARVAAAAFPDRSIDACRAALRDLTVEIDRYRTYLPHDPAGRDVIAQTAARALAHGDADPSEVRELAGAIASPATAEARTLQARWQQLCAPVVAKGDEDRAFYRYHRLAALCEVGGEPGHFGIDADTFHADMHQRAVDQPQALLAGSTHDTKRSEDVRARLLVLSERPDPWRDLVRVVMDRLDPAAHPADGYLALQTAVGAWPVDAARLGAYLEKAAREAAQRTTWTDPDPAYEETLHRLARQLTATGEVGDAVARFAELMVPAGERTSLAQLAIRLTAPGVPDIYQGCETWSLRLVDPDNRQPPDWDGLRRLVAGAAATGTTASGKTEVLARLLRLRRDRPAAFAPGSAYEPLLVDGASPGRALAYLRGDQVAVVVARADSAANAWQDTAVQLPAGRWRDVLDAGTERWGGGQPLTEVLGSRPAAVLVRGSDAAHAGV